MTSVVESRLTRELAAAAAAVTLVAALLGVSHLQGRRRAGGQAGRTSLAAAAIARTRTLPPATPAATTGHQEGIAALGVSRVGTDRVTHATTPRGSLVMEPAANRAPSGAFLRACQDVGSSVAAQRSCEAAAIPSFDAAREAEGLGRLVLPADFAAESPPVQLLTLIDLERVDRGLPAVASLSPYLDSLAQWGAAHGTDPPLPSGRGGGSDWAGGVRSTLLSTFLWLYDDGPRSPNLDCPYASAPGCWAHRRTILSTYANPELMGASSEGSSLAMLLVAGAGLDRSGPTWGFIASGIPVQISASSVDAVAPAGHIAGEHVTIWAPATPTVVHLDLTGPSNAWKLVRTSCDLPAGGYCNAWFAYRPTTSAPSSAQLVVRSATGSEVVNLHGRS